MKGRIAATLIAVFLISILCASCGGYSGGNNNPPPPTPDFSVAANPTAITVNRSISWMTTVTITPTNGFTGAVNLTATGLPTGVTAVFTPAAATTTSVLTLTASASATLGPATVTVTGTNASLTHNASVNLTVGADDNAGFTYNGFDHISFQANEYNTTEGTDSRTALAVTGSNWAGVLATWYQANATATSIAANGSSPTDAAVIAAIQDLHSKNIKVMMKPHVDSLDGSWRGTFHQNSSAEADAWFASYTAFITHYAQIAHDNNVEMFCMGTEYAQLSGAANLARWTNVINAIRAIYLPADGLLTYASNATGGGDEFTSVSFWGQVDLIGLDGYFPLTNHNDPTVAELKAAWTSSAGNVNGLNIVLAVQNFAAAHPGQPIIFTEIGYRSVAGANKAPFDFSSGSTFDPTEQHDCYEAMYEVWSQQTSFLKGVMWWDWGVPNPGANDLGYDVRGKPAEVVVRDWQK